jgi:peptidoglycan/LPS O-acetylase OafA/YrhL
MVGPSSGSRLAGIEGLRAIAAVSIVITHVWAFSMPDGAVLGSGRWVADALSALAVGVTLFFTLSGFLLYRPFAASIARGVPYVPIRSYFWNRFLRIAPAYWAILAISALLLASVYVRDAGGHLGTGRLADPLELLQAALLLQDYHPRTMIIGIGPAWSLAVEVVFYCLLPLLVLAAVWAARFTHDRRGRVLVLLAPPLLLLLVGVSGKLTVWHFLPAPPAAGYSSDWHSVLERSFWAQADLFSFGMAIAVIHTEIADGRLAMGFVWRRLLVVLGLLVFMPCALTMHQGEQSYLLQNTGEALGIALLFAAIVLPRPATESSPKALRLLETRSLVLIGVVSYSLFLWHLPLIYWLREHGLTIDGGWAALVLNLAVVGAVAGGLAALTYRYVEAPALKRKRSTRGRARPETAAIGPDQPLAQAPAATPTPATSGGSPPGR